MDELFAQFPGLFTPEAFSNARAEGQRFLDREMSTQSKSIIPLPPDPNVGGSIFDPTNLDITDPSHRADILKSLTDSATKVRFPPPENLPCANVQVGQYNACNKRGSMACSSCKLVSYCSKVCSVRSHSTTYIYNGNVGVPENPLEAT